LEENSRRQRRQASRKVFPEQEALILSLRRSRQLGIKQLRNKLIRQHGLALSLDTLHRVLVRHGEQHLKRRKLPRKNFKRYSRPIPGNRVQMDTCKIVPGLYQYTAIDDCSLQGARRLPAPKCQEHAGLPRARRGGDALCLQRIQTDRGLELFAETV